MVKYKGIVIYSVVYECLEFFEVNYEVVVLVYVLDFMNVGFFF